MQLVSKKLLYLYIIHVIQHYYFDFSSVINPDNRKLSSVILGAQCVASDVVDTYLLVKVANVHLGHVPLELFLASCSQ